MLITFSSVQWTSNFPFCTFLLVLPFFTLSWFLSGTGFHSANSLFDNRWAQRNFTSLTLKSIKVYLLLNQSYKWFYNRHVACMIHLLKHMSSSIFLISFQYHSLACLILFKLTHTSWEGGGAGYSGLLKNKLTIDWLICLLLDLSNSCF